MNRVKCFDCKLKCFTLVELLVVVAILSLLSLLLLPTLKSSMAYADTAKCASNQRAVGLAVFMFAKDNRNYFPGPTPGGQLVNNFGTIHEQYYLPGMLKAYLGGDEAAIKSFTCPANLKYDPSPNFYYCAFHGTGSGGIPSPWGYLGGTGSHGHPVQISRLPSTCSLLTDIDKMLMSGYPGSNPPVHPGPARNYLFVDGHVKSVSLSEWWSDWSGGWPL